MRDALSPICHVASTQSSGRYDMAPKPVIPRGNARWVEDELHAVYCIVCKARKAWDRGASVHDIVREAQAFAREHRKCRRGGLADRNGETNT